MQDKSKSRARYCKMLCRGVTDFCCWPHHPFSTTRVATTFVEKRESENEIIKRAEKEIEEMKEKVRASGFNFWHSSHKIAALKLKNDER